MTRKLGRSASVWWSVTLTVCLASLVAGLACAATPAGFDEVTQAEGKNWDDLPAPQPAADDWPWWRGTTGASPVLACDRTFVPNEAGKMFVFQTGREFELLAENDMQDGGFASPVIGGRRIYLRTLHTLYCLGKTP